MLIYKHNKRLGCEWLVLGNVALNQSPISSEPRLGPLLLCKRQTEAKQ